MIYNLINLLRDYLGPAYKVLQVFQWPEFRTLCAMIFAFLFVVLLGKPTIRLLLRLKVGDSAEFQHGDLNRLMRNKNATPTMGGVLITGAIFVVTLLLADVTNFYVQMALICLVWLAVVGGVDDYLKLTTARRDPRSRDGLRSWEKLLFQVGIALILGLFIHYYGANNPDTKLLNLPFQRTFVPGTGATNPDLIYLGPWAFGILAVLVIAGSSNAANLTDGMDGLASGIISIIAFAFIVIILITGKQKWAGVMLMPYIPGSVELAVVAGAIGGACLGFLWWNCHPAAVFMGDTGSLPLGGLLGYIAVVIRQEVLLFVIGGVLVFELLSVVLQVSYFKATGGSRIFRCAPIHHHFHLSGWTEQQVVVRFWLISALLAAVGLATLKLR